MVKFHNSGNLHIPGAVPCESVLLKLLHYPSWVPLLGHHRQPPQGLHSCRHLAWQPASPRRTSGFMPRQSCHNQEGLILRPAGFFSFFFSTASRRSVSHFSTQRGGFCTPGTGGAFTVSTEAVPIPSAGTATEVRPLTSSPSSRGQSSGGALWRPVETCLHPWSTVKPVGCTLTPLYSPCT